jgi:hypothetical protein
VHQETLLAALEYQEKNSLWGATHGSYYDYLSPENRASFTGSVEAAAIVLAMYAHAHGEVKSAEDMAVIWGAYRTGIKDFIPGDKGKGYGSLNDFRRHVANQDESLPSLPERLKIGGNAYMSQPYFQFFEKVFADQYYLQMVMENYWLLPKPVQNIDSNTETNPAKRLESALLATPQDNQATAQNRQSDTYRVSSNAQVVPHSERHRHWQDETPTNQIQVTKDSQGNVKVFSYQANMTVDADGDTPNVLGKTRIRQVKTELKSQHADWTRTKVEQEAKRQVRTEARVAHKYFDADKLDKTALQWGGKQLNANQVPYIVVPPVFQKAGNVKKGDLALVRYQNRTVYAVVGDVGPDYKAGEASMRTARALGINDNPGGGRHGGGVGAHDQSVEYIILPGSGRQFQVAQRTRTFDEIQILGRQAFAKAKQDGFVD